MPYAGRGKAPAADAPTATVKVVRATRKKDGKPQPFITLTEENANVPYINGRFGSNLEITALMCVFWMVARFRTQVAQLVLNSFLKNDILYQQINVGLSYWKVGSQISRSEGE